MQIEPSGDQVLARAAHREGFGNAPVLAVELHQLAAHGEAGQLFEQQTALPASCQTQLADQLLVSGLLAGGVRDAFDQFLIRHSSRVGHWHIFCDTCSQDGMAELCQG